MIFIAVIAFGDFILPLLSFRDKRPYLQRLEEIHYKELQYDTVMDKISYAIGFNWFRFVVVILVLIWVAYSAGLGEARTRKEFYVLVDDRDKVVVRIYGSTFITSKIDRKANTLSSQIEIIRLGEGQTLKLVGEAIGTLQIIQIDEERESDKSNKNSN